MSACFSMAWPQLGEVLDPDALSSGTRTFVMAMRDRHDLPERLARMGLLLRNMKQRRDARLVAEAGRSLAPGDFRVRAMTEWLVRRQAPLWHFPMLHDELRNDAYARALAHYVRPGMTVFEVGTGSGILAMLAARAGAHHVYTCERREDVANVAREIVERNGFADRITVITKDVRDLQLGVDLPDRADLFVAEVVDNNLLGEGVLPITELSRARFLKPDAPLLPQRVSMMGCLVSGQGNRQQYRVGTVMDFDLTPFNRFTPLIISTKPESVDPLSDAEELIGFDLREDAPDHGKRELELCATRAGVAEGVVNWLRLDFGAGIVLENRPPQPTSWSPLFHVLPEPRAVSPGTCLPVEINHTREHLFLIPGASQ